MQQRQPSARRPPHTTRRAHFARVLADTPWASKANQYFHTREEEYVHGLRCALGIW